MKLADLLNEKELELLNKAKFDTSILFKNLNISKLGVIGLAIETAKKQPIKMGIDYPIIGYMTLKSRENLLENQSKN